MDMDPEDRRIWQLIGSLSDEFRRRITQPGVSPLEEMMVPFYRPVNDEEKRIWAEITAPSNYASLRHFVEPQLRRDITDYSRKLYEDLLAEAKRRWGSEGLAC
jgi:hypothetical protein